MSGEIYCIPGKLKVKLPSEAWEESGEVSITPCDGCSHKFHKKQLDYIKSESDQAELINLETVVEYKHAVSVIKYLGKPTVICNCDCTIRYPTSGNTN